MAAVRRRFENEGNETEDIDFPSKSKQHTTLLVDAHAFDSTHSLQVQSIGRGIFGELAGGRCRRGAAVHSARSSSARELIFYLLHAPGSGQSVKPSTVAAAGTPRADWLIQIGLQARWSAVDGIARVFLLILVSSPAAFLV